MVSASLTRLVLLPLAFLFLVVFFLYSNTFKVQFNQIDDYGYIVQYGHFDRPLNFRGLKEIFSTISQEEMLHDYYRPIYTLIRTIDYRLYGARPAGYHATNIFFYILAVTACYLILLKLTSHWLASMVSTLLFAVHPLHVEVVTWIMAGGYVISGAFLLWAFYFYLKRSLVGSVLSYALACLANPPAVVMPLLVAGHIWLFPSISKEERRFRRQVLGGLLLTAGAVVLLNFVIFPQHYAGSFFDMPTAAMTWIGNFFKYVQLMILPLKLHLPREGYIQSPVDSRFLAGGIILVFFTGSCWRFRKIDPIMAFGIFWFLVSLAPTLSVWKNPTTMADRYVFVPSLGGAVILTAFIHNFAEVKRHIMASPKGVVISLFGPLFIFYSVLTVQRNKTWHDTETIMTDTLKKNPGNVFAAKTLACYYAFRENTPAKAIPFLEKTIQLTHERLQQLKNTMLIRFEKGNEAELYNTMAIVLREMGRYEEAFDFHKRADVETHNADFYFHWALTHDKAADTLDPQRDTSRRREHLEKAMVLYRKSIELRPSLSYAYQNAGRILMDLNRPSEVIPLLEHALRLTPRNIEVMGLLAKAFFQVGEIGKAKHLLEKAIPLSKHRQKETPLIKGLEQLRSSLEGKEIASATSTDEQRFFRLFSERKFSDALEVALYFEKIQTTPNARWLNNIGLCYYKLDRYEQAEYYYKKALYAQPNHIMAHSNLSLLYGKIGKWPLAVEYGRKALALDPMNPTLRKRLEDYARRQLEYTPSPK